MKDVIVIIAVTAVIVFGFFIMKRLDAFLEENRKAIEKEQEEQCSPLELFWYGKLRKYDFRDWNFQRKT